MSEERTRRRGTESPHGQERASRFEQAARRETSLVRDIFDHVRQNKKWFFLPILGVFLILGALLVLSGTAVAPFIYTLF